jgi:hypothetical protein
VLVDDAGCRKARATEEGVMNVKTYLTLTTLLNSMAHVQNEASNRYRFCLYFTLADMSDELLVII